MQFGMRDDKILNMNVWRHLVNFWAVVLYIVIIWDFFLRNGLHEFLGPLSAIYLAALAIYSAQKEFERWHDHNIGIHPGEMYVFIWTFLIIILFILEWVYKSEYVLPSEVFTTYLVVIGVLAITKRSKKRYLKKKGK